MVDKICIASRFDRYNIFFELWLKNCLNYKFDIVIFLDGENQTIFEKIAELEPASHKIFIIDIQKYGNIHNIDNLSFFKQIFDILYFDMGYETVIYTDPDELLLVDDFEIFLKTDYKFLASKGFEMFQYKDESHYDLSKSLIQQRKYGFWSEKSYNPVHSFYDKICIFKKNNYPITVGRHATECSTPPAQIENNFIFLTHLRDICKKTIIDNSNENIIKYQKNHKQHSLNSKEDVDHWLETWFYPYMVEIPDEIKKILSKHDI